MNGRDDVRPKCAAHKHQQKVQNSDISSKGLNDISLQSLNVRGLLEKNKRRSLLSYVKNQKADIIFLQETHFTTETKDVLSREWQGPCFQAFGSNCSRGVAILIKPSASFMLIDCKYLDSNGRTLLLNCTIDDIELCLVNIYAPNKVKERNNFIVKLSDWLSSLDPTNLICGGDINCVLNPELDKKGGRLDTAGRSAKVVKKLCSRLEICDAYRLANPTTQQFTWRNLTKNVACRLDFWLIHKTLVGKIDKCDIRPAILTDHQAIFLKLKFHNYARGPGTFKLNVDLLRDKEYFENICNLIQQESNKNTTSNRDKLDLCIIKVAEFSKQYGAKKARESREQIERLEKKVSFLQNEIDKNPTNDNILSYKQAQSRLEDLYMKKITWSICKS